MAPPVVYQRLQSTAKDDKDAIEFGEISGHEAEHRSEKRRRLLRHAFTTLLVLSNVILAVLWLRSWTIAARPAEISSCVRPQLIYSPASTAIRYEKSESFHGSEAEGSGRGTDGPMQVTSVSASESGERKYPLRDAVKDAWASLGVPQNLERKGGSIAGLVDMHENSRDGQRQPSYAAYPLDGVQVLANTLVQRVTFSGTTATGVELADGRKLTARKELILCGGAYRTPQLLILSGIGPSEALAEHGIPMVKNLPQVGSNLHDHFAVYLAFRLRDPALGYAMGSPTWQNPALFKGLPWDWVVSQPLPGQILSRHEPDHAAKRERNLYEILTLYVPPGIPGIPVDGTHIATSTVWRSRNEKTLWGLGLSSEFKTS